MQQAATEVGEPLSDISMKGVLDVLNTSRSAFQALRHKRLQRERLKEQLLRIFATTILAIRPFRQEPRAKKRRSKPYQLLTAPRGKFREIPHKGNYRKLA